MDIYSIGIKADTRDIDRGKKRLDDFAKSADNVDKKTGRARDSLGRFVKGVGSADGAMSKANKSLDSFNAAFRIFSGIAGGLTIGKVVRDLAEFESSMSRLESITLATSEEMARFREQARILGATTIKTAKEVADAQTFFAMAGFNANEVLAATPGIIAMSTAASLDLAKAADIASNVLSGFGYEVSELNRVNDVLVKTASSANTSVEQLGSALSYVAPFAATANISIEETASAIGKLGDAGLQGERGGTGLIGVIRQLSNVTPKAKEVLESVGVSIKDVDVSVNGLQKVIELLSTKNLSLAETFTIFGTEAGPAASILMKSAEGMRELTAANTYAEGTTQKASDIISKSLNASILSFNSALSESVLQVGESQTYLNDLIKTVTGVISVYNGMLPQFVQSNNLSAEQAQNVENLAVGFQVLGTAVGTIAGIRSALFLAEAAQMAFNAAVFKNPYVLIATTAITAAVAIYKLQQATSDIEQVWENAAKSSEHYQAALSRQPELELHLKKLHSEREIRLALLAGAEKNLETATAEGSKHAIKNYQRQVDIHKGYADKINSDISRIELSVENATKNYEDAKKRESDAAKKAHDDAVSFAIEQAEMERKKIESQIKAKEELEETTKKFEALWRQSDPVAAGLKDIEEGFLLIEKAMEQSFSTEQIESAREYLKKLKKEIGAEKGDLKEVFSLLYPEDIELKKITDAYNALDEAVKKGLISKEQYDFHISRLDKITEKSLSSADEMSIIYEDAAKRIDAVFADVWMNLEDGFNGVSDGLKTAFKRMLAEMAHAATTQKIMVSMGMAQAGTATINPYAAISSIAVLGISAAIENQNKENDKRMEKFTAEYRQKEQFTGTILGDISSKSNSIKNITDDMSDLSKDALSINRKMYDSLKNIENGIGAVAALIAQSFGLTGFSPFRETETIGSSGSVLASAANPFLTQLSMFGDNIISDFAGGLINGIASGISSKKVELIDAGIEITEQSIAQMVDGQAIALRGFQDIKTTKTSFWSKKSSVSTQYSEIETAIQQQLGSIFIDIASVLRDAGGYLSGGAKDVDSFVNSLIVSGQKISLKGLTGEEIEKEIEAFLSSTLDMWSKSTLQFVGLADWQAKYQKTGEGLAETLSRVVSESRYFEQQLELLGKTFVFSGSFAVEATQIMANLSGGFDKLAEATNFYYENFFSESERLQKTIDMLGPAFARLGYSSIPKTHEEMRVLVNSLDLTAIAGQNAFVELMKLAPSIDLVAKATEKARSNEADRIKSNISEFNSLLDTLKQFNRIEAQVSDLTRRKQAELVISEALVAARSGVVPDQSALSKAISVVNQVSMSDFASRVDYVQATAKTASNISELLSITEQAISFEEKQLSYFEEQLDISNKSFFVLSEIAASLGANGFASGGYHSGGLRIVGENGPELEMTGPSRIMNQNQLNSVVSKNSELKQELAEIKQYIQSGFYAVAKNTLDTSKQLQRWDGDGLPQERGF